ncbi:MAG: protein translocase subunit SecF [Candidatus Kaiserbacteria bacterium]|nr:protein translocase subunit SecF [Candidatus Kaiserbacteria bacterium]
MVSNHAKIHAFIGIGLIVLSVLCTLIIGPNIAPEFAGRAELQVVFTEAQEDGVAQFGDIGYAVAIQQVSATEYTFTTQSLDADAYSALQAHIAEQIGEFEVKEYRSYSPSISKELLYKAVLALLVAVGIIIVYISLVFRKSSRPVASWKYGITATFALVHDTIIPLGLFAIIAPFTTAMVDTLFVTALLATLGYSINDTIVVFDRMRDRLRMNREKNRKEPFTETVDYGVRSSLRRSLYTSVSTVTPLVLLFLFVSATQWFSIALFAGVVAGTYSSLFFAPSLLLLWHHHFPQKDKKDQKLSETEAAEKMLRNSFQDESTL